MLSYANGDHGQNGDVTPPATPRQPAGLQSYANARRDDSTTPTRANFGALPPKKPLPSEPPTSAAPVADTAQDVSMNGSDESRDQSDDESVTEENADNSNATDDGKKKKSQRFYCVDYPPCVLSFTRSEHLARHIRKHTGERPFQCHCSRRFSRLDNLRQHAQTVHVNEDIPMDSLAATGARFQRQVRTDRVRPPGARSRPTTAGGPSGPIRGHQRNSLSASSISSIGSVYGMREDARRRPPPLAMPGGSRPPGDGMFPESPGPYHYRPHSPGAYGTPSSSTFSTGPSSPRWSGSFQSPQSGHSRSHSLYSSTPHTPSRRLSVPSSSYPYPSSRGGSYGPPQATMNSPMMSPSMLSSPASSVWGRRDSVSGVGDETYKRKTWAHPEPYSPFATRVQDPGLSQYRSAPDAPSHGPAEQGQMRLPGIESFDSMPRSATPVYRQPSPMAVDTPSRPPVLGEAYHERRSSQHWESGEPRSFPDRGFDSAGAWASEANWAVQARAEQARAVPSQVRFEDSAHPERAQRSAYQHQSAPVVTPREAKRQAWYQGPVAHPPEPPVDPQLQRTSPEGSSSSEGVPGTPSSSTARESHPSIVHANGYVENQGGFPIHDPRAGSNYPPAHNPDAAYTYAHGQQAPQAEPQDQQPKAADSSMLRLEALVAVATSEENVAATAY